MIKQYIVLIAIMVSFTSINAQTLSVNFSKTERQCVLAEAAVTILTGAQPIQVSWSNNKTSTSIDQLQDGDYSVKITDNLNQDTTIYFTITTLICEPVAETHFTPNGDDYNDNWNISRLEYFPEFELFVYNRWGQQVHHQANQFNSWDGKSLNIPLPDATYYYILYFSKNDKNNFIKGNVSIIR